MAQGGSRLLALWEGEEYSKSDEGQEQWEKGQIGPSSTIFRIAGGENVDH